jgi:hypothetical protein
MATTAAVGLAAAGGYFVRRPAPAPVRVPATDPGPGAELDALKNRMEQLEKAMSYGGARLSSLESAAASGSGSPGIGAAPDGGAGVVRHDPLSREELTERQARQAARLEAALTDEPRDRSWAPGFESALQDSVEATVVKGQGPTIESVSCRTSVCRLQLAYATQDIQRQFLEEFPAHRPPMTAARWTNSPSSDGTGKLTIDFVREGYPVPGTEESTN